MNRLLNSVDPIFRLVILIAVVSGAPFFLIGASEASSTQQQIAAYASVRGVVVDNAYLESDAGDSSSGAYYPVIEFKPNDGPLQRFTDGAGSLPPDYAVGAQVDVIYNPAQPAEARLASWFRLWFVPTLLIGIGLLPVSVVLIILIKVRRSR